MKILSKCKAGHKKAQRKIGLLMIAVFVCVTFMSFGIGVASATDSSVTAQSVVSGGGAGLYPAVFGDVNGDGSLDAADAILILQKIVGIIDRFPIEANIPSETEVVEHVMAIQFSVNDGDYLLHCLQYDDSESNVLDPQGFGSTAAYNNIMVYPLNKDCTFTGGSSILDMVEGFVTLELNNDREITHITATDSQVIGPAFANGSILNSIKVVNGKALVEGRSYSFLPVQQIAMEGVFPTEFVPSGSTIADGIYNLSDAYRLIFNKNGKIAGIRALTYPTPGIVQGVVGQRIIYQDNSFPRPVMLGAFSSYAGVWKGYSNQYNFKDMDILVERNGQAATLEDIKPLDTVSVLQGYRGVDYYLVVTDNKVNGNLNAAIYSGGEIKKLRVKGREYITSYANFNFLGGAPVSCSASYSMDGGNEFAGHMVRSTLESEYDIWDQSVTLLLSASGKVAGLIANENPAENIRFGVITEIAGMTAWTDGTAIRNIKVLQADGNEYTYPICNDTYIKMGAANTKVKDLASLNTIDDLIMSKDTGTQMITAGNEKLVVVTLRNNGLVDRIEVINQADQLLTVANIDTDNKQIKIAGAWVDAADVVVFNLNNGMNGVAARINDLYNTRVLGWEELKNALGTSLNAWYVNSSTNKLEYVLVNAGLAGMSLKVAPKLDLTIGSENNYVETDVNPADAANLVITYVSSNPAIATVSTTGEVTPVAAGATTITITATSAYGTKTATCEVTVSAALPAKYGVITGITSMMVWKDGTTIRNIKVLQADGNEYTYPICNDTYIKMGAANTKVKDLTSLNTIDDLIMSKDTGTQMITAGNEKLVVVTLRNNGLVDRIEVINQADQLLTVANIDTDNKQIKIAGAWVDAADVVVFNLNNGMNGVAARINDLYNTRVLGWEELKNALGTSLNAWYVNSSTNKLEYVLVNAGLAGMSLKVAPKLDLTIGSENNYVETDVNPADAANLVITYVSSNPAIATVSTTGEVTPVAAGATTITITATSAYGTKTATCEVTVSAALPVKYGVITGITSMMAWKDGTTIRNIKVLQSDGKEYTYPICNDTYIKTGAVSTRIKDIATLNTIDDYIMSKDAGATSITTGAEKLVGVLLNTNGLVDRIDVINQADQLLTVANIDTANKQVKIAGAWVDAADVVVFNLNNGMNRAATTINDLDNTRVLGWGELKNALGTSLNAWYVNTDNQLEYVVVNAPPMTTGIKYAIYQERFNNSDDWVKFVGHEPYLLGNSIMGLTKGDVVAYEQSGSEVNISLRAVPYGTASGISVYKSFGSVIQLSDGSSWRVDPNTVYLDNSNADNLMVLTSVAVGDVVIVIPDSTDSSLAAAIILVN